MRYVYKDNGAEKERGLQSYEIKVEGVEHAETPLRLFKDCLLIRTTALRTDDTGAQKGYELREWHARGVGVVKVEGALYWKNARGETTRTFKVGALLEKSLVKSGKVR